MATELPVRSIVVREPRALVEDDLRLMRLPERFWGAAFEKISNGRHRRVIGEYLRKIDSAMAHGFGLLLWGDNDVGKTSAASVVAKHARRHGFTVLFVTAEDLLRGDANRVFFDAARTKTIHDRACDVDLLVVDDLGHEKHAESGYEAGHAPVLFEGIVRTRSSRLRSMLFTSNLSPDKIRGVHDDGTVREDALYRKSMSKVLKGCVLPIQVVGPSLREPEAAAVKSFLDKKRVG